MLELGQDSPHLPPPSKENHNAALQWCICEISNTWAPFDYEGIDSILVPGQENPRPQRVWYGPSPIYSKQKEQSSLNLEIIENRLLLTLGVLFCFGGESQDRADDSDQNTIAGPRIFLFL